MRRIVVLSSLLALVGCVAPSEFDEEGIGGKADSAVMALEGTREGAGVLRLLNDTEGTTFALLDDAVGLDRRAARNLIDTRDGVDGRAGTDDDVLYPDIASVDAVRWVGASALMRLSTFALENDYVPGDSTFYGRFDGVDFTYLEAESVLAFSNEASDSQLREASVPSRAVASILDARPIADLATLAGLYWVGTATLEHLKSAVTVEAEDALCETQADCAPGTRCTGRPSDGRVGRCRDAAHYPHLGQACADDDACPDGICIAASIYGEGYCTAAWMRETFSRGGEASLSPVVMSEPTAFPITVFGQASVPEDIVVELDLTHSDPSSLWIGLQPPTGQEPVTLWDGASMQGPMPSVFVDRAIYRDDEVNGRYALLIQNVEGRGEGVFRGYRLTVSSRWD